MADGIKRYRDFGGKLALVYTCLTDLTAASSKLGDDESFDLRCGPEEAAERLGRVADLGYDDILLVKADHTRSLPLYEPDFTVEDLAAIRALLPRDSRKPYEK